MREEPENLDTLRSIFDDQNPPPPPAKRSTWVPGEYRVPRDPHWFEEPSRVAALCTTILMVTLVTAGCIIFLGWVIYVMAKLNGA